MQEENKKILEKQNKKTLLRAVAKVIKKLRGDSASASKFYLERGLGPTTYLPIENAQAELKITTFYKLSNVFGISFSEFARLVEKELPEGFIMFEED